MLVSKTDRFLPQGTEGEQSQVNKIISGSDEGYETKTQDRVDEASASDGAVMEGFFELPLKLRLKW